MSQNLVSLTLTEAQLAAVDQALTDIEVQLGGLVALTVKQRRGVPKMGDKSEAFCRQTLSLLEQNPQLVPPSVSVADARADLLAFDQLRPRMLRLQRLSEKVTDTDCARQRRDGDGAGGVCVAEGDRQTPGSGRPARRARDAIRQAVAGNGGQGRLARAASILQQRQSSRSDAAFLLPVAIQYRDRAVRDRSVGVLDAFAPVRDRTVAVADCSVAVAISSAGVAQLQCCSSRLHGR